MMKPSVIFLLAALVLAGCNGKKDGGVVLTGKAQNAPQGQMVKLEKYGMKGLEGVDSAKIGEEGQYELVVAPGEPTFYRLNFFNQRSVNLVLNGEEDEVVVNLDVEKPEEAAEITGSEHTTYVMEIDAMLKARQQEVQSLNQEGIQARMQNDQVALEDLTDQYYYIMEEGDRKLKAYLWKVQPSLAAFYGLSALDMDSHFPFYDSLATAYKEALPEHEFTKDLVQRVDQMRALAVGSQAPDLALPTPTGEELTLSSLRGNYVLIDFWAAWCRPCRAENPNVVRLYNKYKDKNFEILGVSFDKNKEAWVDAIKADGLTWKHISDLKHFQSEAAQIYNITSIPATYLIDPEGKIVAKGLRGPTLEAKLEELFG